MAGTFRFRADASKLRAVEQALVVAGDGMRRRTGELLVDTIRSKIRSRSGRLADSWKARRHGDDVVIGTYGLPYGRASVKGAFIRARGRALVFEAAGKTVFAKRVRLSPGHWIGRPGNRGYVDVALDEFETVAGRAFNETYGRIT